MAAAPQQQSQQPPASTAEQHAPLFASGVLPVMLQHPAISRECATVCRLMCSSKALRSAVLQHAGGMVDLECDEASWQGMCCWLSSHGHLLRSLTFGQPLAMPASICLASGLQAAAAAVPGGLRLRVFQARLPSAMAGLVLQPLPAHHLTRLWLSLGNAAQHPDPCVQLTAQALAA